MLNNVKTILYASDVEGGARPAFRAALSLCDRYDARVVYLHVVEKLSVNAMNAVKNIIDKEELEVLKQEGLEHLHEKVTARVHKFFESPDETTFRIEEGIIECRIEEGNPSSKIVAVAKEIDADIIVMGIRDKHDSGFLHQGSHAHKVINQAACPVMVVPL